ncbi:MAG: hypothetical protein MHMPM18_002566 [Marteilia pararefringens]
MDVRRVMVLVKRSTKQRNILQAYTNIAAKIDVVTRWNQTLAMLKRFLRISDHLRKASFDSQEMKKRMVFATDENIQAIKSLCEMLQPFDTVTKSLSANNVNLHSAVLHLT